MSGGLGAWLLWLGPALAGFVVAALKKAEVIAFVDRASEWCEVQHQAARSRSGWIRGGVWRWLTWGLHKLHLSTVSIEDGRLRAGLRTGLFFYIAALSLFVVASLIYLALALAMLAVGCWLVGKALRFNEEINGTSTRRAPMAARSERSRERRDLWGDRYTEHVGDGGARTGTSRTKTDIWGDTYVERRSADGKVQETTRLKSDIFGDEFAEHKNSDGQVTGRSRERTDWLGERRTEHADNTGEVVSASRDRKDWLGDRYRETKPKS